jgi:hypothetical protein
VQLSGCLYEHWPKPPSSARPRSRVRSSVRFLIVGACLLLIAAATPAVSRSGGAAGCGSEQLRLSVQSQGENTTAWIGVSIRNRGRGRNLDGVMTFKILGAGRLLRIAGDPLRVRTSGLLGAHGTRLIRADWSNWCGNRSGQTLRVKYAARTVTFAFTYSPVCLNADQPSRLVSIP